mmetsp:Transcript_25337/g.55317  ORF Transcript_25337/g.55317 Transcript_25337/m.55317 type:complete len:259 (-) Transcript_25337:421-1197(-)
MARGGRDAGKKFLRSAHGIVFPICTAMVAHPGVVEDISISPIFLSFSRCSVQAAHNQISKNCKQEVCHKQCLGIFPSNLMLVDLKQQQQQHHLPPQISHAGNNTCQKLLERPAGIQMPPGCTMKCGQQHVENVAKVAIDACCIVASTRAHGGPKNGKQHNDSEANQVRQHDCLKCFATPGPESPFRASREQSRPRIQQRFPGHGEEWHHPAEAAEHHDDQTDEIRPRPGGRHLSICSEMEGHPSKVQLTSVITFFRHP